MNNSTTKILLLALALMLMACGPQKYSHTPSESLSSTEPTTTTKAVSYCSKDMSNLSDLGFSVKSYDLGSQQDRTRFLRIKIDRFPTSFSADPSSGMEVHVFHVNNSGQVVRRELALIGLESSSASQKYVEDPKREGISFQQIKNLGYASGEKFFTSFNLIVDTFDGAGSAKVVSVVLNRGASERRITHQANGLIPSFYANPKDYADAGKPDVLKNLHPLKSWLGQNLTSGDFENKAQALCF
jgi:hypothetical protein